MKRTAGWFRASSVRPVFPCNLRAGSAPWSMSRRPLIAVQGAFVIGTAAVRDPDFVKEAAKFHPDQIVLAVDVYRGRVAIDGWRALTAFEPARFVEEFSTAPLAAILVTDVDNYAGDSDGSVGMISMVADAARSPVIAGGIADSLDDISRLKYVRNIAGAQVGRALFNRSIAIEEALAVARAVPMEPVAEMI